MMHLCLVISRLYSELVGKDSALELNIEKWFGFVIDGEVVEGIKPHFIVWM